LLAAFLVQLGVMLLLVEAWGVAAAAAAELAAAAAAKAVAQGVMQHLKQQQPHTHLLQQVYQSPLVNRSSSSRVQFWVGWAGLVKC
jgi:ABC-type transporter MlaC component